MFIEFLEDTRYIQEELYIGDQDYSYLSKKKSKRFHAPNAVNGQILTILLKKYIYNNNRL